MNLTPTASQTAGPYFHLGCIKTRAANCLAGPEARGYRVRLSCRVFDADEIPINDAMIEIWQADAEGRYHHPDDPRASEVDPHCTGFGRLATDAQGTCIFDTIKPGCVPGNDGRLQAPHLNVSLFARGILRRFTTRIYFADDPTNSDDPILALVPKDRRNTLIAQPSSSRTDWRFDIHFGGEQETVFFEV
jgi:protocatechuate 3,4-dioxygenase alpha subunit